MPFPPADHDHTWTDDPGQVIRPYTITAGRSGQDHDGLQLTTLVSSVLTRHTMRTATPEQREILRSCAQRVLSVAELGAHLDLPVNVIRVLLADLHAAGMIIIRSPGSDHHSTSIDTLEALLHGLHAL